jgi:hypothetical protein
MVDVLVSADLVHTGGQWTATAYLGGAVYGHGTFSVTADTEQATQDLFIQQWADTYPPPDQDPPQWIPENFQFTG